ADRPISEDPDSYERHPRTKLSFVGQRKIADCPALGPVTPKVVNELLIVAWAWRMIAVAAHPRARTSVDGIFSPEYGLPARAPAMARAWANSLSSGREHGRSPHPHSSEQPL